MRNVNEHVFLGLFKNVLFLLPACLILVPSAGHAYTDEQPPAQPATLSPQPDLKPKLRIDDMPWLDQPGNKLKLAGIVVGSAALIPIGMGIALLADSTKPCQGECWGNAYAGLFGGVILIGGLVIGIVGAGLGLGGYSKNVEVREAEKLTISPYAAPVITRNGDSVSVTGGQVGLSMIF